ncbi:survival of motor neuron protein [Belonocnema kinseyi]|uniref:survival of motor neuron protein n=1 Tax=Belonocnema kinseyi TaxID=2817044 RepID=UPI00143DB0D4|nr:survival of motor neuron protein [Belonocnema kinseyi]
MDEEDDVLFVRRNSKTMNDATHEDVWDDSALIKAYDKAVNLAKEEVTKRMGLQESPPEKPNKSAAQKEHRHSHKMQRKWCVGSPCRAIYSEDGELYEAIITKMQENTGTCIVKFIGYDNTEKVELASLLESEGLQSQIAQQKASLLDKSNASSSSPPEASELPSEPRKMNGVPGENMDCDFHETKTSKNSFASMPTTSSFLPAMGVMPPAPPLPPHLMSKLPENDADALSSMLMAWYLSGFHTGYYHGLKQARSAQEKRKK